MWRDCLLYSRIDIAEFYLFYLTEYATPIIIAELLSPCLCHQILSPIIDPRVIPLSDYYHLIYVLKSYLLHTYTSSSICITAASKYKCISWYYFPDLYRNAISTYTFLSIIFQYTLLYFMSEYVLKILSSDVMLMYVCIHLPVIHSSV